MTKSEIFKLAHELARAEMKRHADFYGNKYSVCFADEVRAIYATLRYETECDARYGVTMRPSFQVVEPERLWA